MAGLTFEEAFNQIVEDAESVSTKMSVEDKAAITKAQASVFKQALKEEVKSKHYRDRVTGESPHLADTVISQNKSVDGFKNGTSTVGWNKDKAYIANFLENGTKFPMYSRKGRKFKRAGQVAVRADHFVRNLRNDPVLHERMLLAGASKYAQIIKKRGG